MPAASRPDRTTARGSTFGGSEYEHRSQPDAGPPQPVTKAARSPRDGPTLWVVSLDDLAGEPICIQVLNAEERRRTHRFHSRRLARRYTAGRAALRMLLGAALDLAPQAVPLETGPLGKPQLACRASISFNLAHCDETAVIGLTAGDEIGVDIESSIHVHDPCRVAARFFAPSETAILAALAPDLATTAFLRCWTVKEAVLKALGVGLSLSLDAVVVDADPRVPLRLRRVPPPGRPLDWTLDAPLVPDRRLAVAVAIAAPEAPTTSVRTFDLEAFAVTRSSRRRPLARAR